MGKKFSRCIRQDTLGTADESYVGRETLQGISVQKPGRSNWQSTRTLSGHRTLLALTTSRACDLDHWQWKAQLQFIVQINLNVVQSELLELYSTEIVHVRRVAFHLL